MLRLRRTLWFRSGFVRFSVLMSCAGVLACKQRVDQPPSLFRLRNVRTDVDTLVTLGSSRPGLVVFWATWCGPCRTELPELQRELGALDSAGVKVVTISIDESPPEVVKAFADRYSLSFPVFQDRGGLVTHLLHPTGIPLTLAFYRDTEVQLLGTVNWESSQVRSLKNHMARPQLVH